MEIYQLYLSGEFILSYLSFGHLKEVQSYSHFIYHIQKFSEQTQITD